MLKVKSSFFFIAITVCSISKIAAMPCCIVSKEVLIVKAPPTTEHFSDTIPTESSSIQVRELDLMENHFKEIFDDLEELEERIKVLKEKYSTQSLLSEKEKRIMDSYQKVINLYNEDNNRKDFNHLHERIAKGIIEYSNTIFDDYKKMSIDQRNEKANELTACYEEMAEVYFILTDIPDRVTNIDESYMREVWNPYTFTNMDERLKNRLYDAYERDMMPYLVEELESTIDCKATIKNAVAIRNLTEKMMELREEDTEDLEKLLRKAKSPKEMLETINVIN